MDNDLGLIPDDLYFNISIDGDSAVRLGLALFLGIGLALTMPILVKKIVGS